MTVERTPFKNLLLRTLSTEDQALLLPMIRRVELPLRQPLETAHQTIETAYFLETGLASIVARKDGGSSVEVGLVGCEGMTGTSLTLRDTESPFDCFVQMESSAMCISTDNLRKAMSRSETLSDLLIRYARTIGVQTTYTALASGQIKIEERLARWILMVHDRMYGDAFFVTHEFLGMMLGVQRPGVTIALQTLELKHLIGSQRGEVQVKNRDGLMRLAKGTYGPSELEYERLIGIQLAKSRLAPQEDPPLPRIA
jgi:CRP-like cAMP-binding protein